MNKITKRIKSPTPKFFKKVRNTGLALAAIGAVILGSPVTLPAIALKVAEYLTVAGAVAGAVSQTTVKNDK